MLNQGIGSWSARRARKTPDRIALVHEDRTWTYRDLHERVLRLAHALRAQGVGRATGSPTSAPTTRRSWRPCSPPAPSARSSSPSTPG
ncbi:hypothetical protein SHIRM173S_07925 [Streptomyces hirsutus]